MTSLLEDISKALLPIVQEYDSDAVEVTSWEDRTRWGGYCETCEYEYAVVEISYRDNKGRSRLYTYDSSFATLVSRL